MAVAIKEYLFGSHNTYPTIDLDMDNIEDRGETIEQWTSPDGRHKVIVAVMGGKEWEGIWLKDVILICTDQLAGGEMMRVQSVKRTDANDVVNTVFIDVFRFGGEFGYMENYSYSSDNGGILEEVGKVTFPNHKAETTTLDYLEALTYVDVHLMDEIPKAIDVNETIRVFLEQLEERRFTKPILIKI